MQVCPVRSEPICPNIQDFYSKLMYHNVPKFSDRHVWANSADPDQTEQSDQSLH